MSAAEIASSAPLAAPQNLAAAPGPLSLDLSWSAVANATRYTVKYSTTSGGPYLNSAPDPPPAQLHSGLTDGPTYYYVVPPEIPTTPALFPPRPAPRPSRPTSPPSNSAAAPLASTPAPPRSR